MRKTDGHEHGPAPRTAGLARASLVALALAVIALLVVAGPAQAGTTVSSDITSDTTWDLAGSPYTLTTTITVADSDAPVLTIEAGVEVRFDPGARLKIANSTDPGVLRANGTDSSPITFTSSVSAPAPGDHQGLRFEPSSAATSFIQNASIAYSGDSGVSGLEIENHPVELANLNISQGASNGLWMRDANPSVTNLSLWNNGDDGIDLHTSSPTITNTTVEDSGNYGINAHSASARPTLRDVHIQESDNAPARLPVDTDLSTTTFGPEPNERLELWGTTLTSDRTLPLPTDVADGNEFHLALLSDLEVNNGATLTIQPGIRLEMGGSVDLIIGDQSAANLDAQGTEADPITLTKTGGDEWQQLLARNGASSTHFTLRNATIEQHDNWGVRLRDRPNAVVDNVTIEGQAATGSGIRSYNSDVRARNVDVNNTAAEGIKLLESTFSFENVSARNASHDPGVLLFRAGGTWNEGSVEDAAGHGIRVDECRDPTLKNLTIRNADKYGLWTDEACGRVDLHDVVIEDIAQRAWRNRVDATYDNVTLKNIGVLELDYLGGRITADQTLERWTTPTGDAYVSRILGSVSVKESATLTVEAGNRLLMGRNVGVQVGDCCNTDAEDSGSLVVEGTTSNPVTIEPITPGDPWNHILVRNGLSTPIELRNTTVRGPNDNYLVELRDDGVLDNVTLQGATQHGLKTRFGIVEARNVVLNDTQGVRALSGSTLDFQDVTVQNVTGGPAVRLDDDATSLAWNGGQIDTTPGHGIRIDDCGSATLRDLAIEDTADYGLSVDTACGRVDLHGVHFEDIGTRAWRNPFDATYENVTFTNVGIQELDYLQGQITADRTLPAYETSNGDRLTHRLMESFDVRNGAQLTVEPGNRIEAHDEATIIIGKCCGAGPGSLVAHGTQAHPTTFTAIDPNQGWRGILTDHAASDSVFELRNVTVEHATGSLSSGPVTIRNHPGASLDNVTLQGSASSGLDLALSTLDARNVLIEDTASYGLDANDGTLDMRNVTIRNVADTDGVRLHSGASVTWDEGRVEATGALGIRAGHSSLSLSDITIRNPADLGMFVHDSDGAQLVGLDVSGATTGIKLTDIEGATIKDSVLKDNDLGVWIKSDATGSLLYNNKLDNPTNADDAAPDTRWNVTPTKLDNGTNICGGSWLGGNCWSDYTGEDTDGDGVGDTQLPYDLGIAGTGDQAPLVAHGPKDLRATPGDRAGIIELDWTGTIPEADTYHVKRSTTQGGPYTGIATTGEPSFTDTGLGDQRYYYVVEGRWANGVSAGTTDEASAEPRIPPPLNPTAEEGQEPGTVDLSWQAPSTSGDLTYRVYRSTEDGGPYTLVAETAETTYTDTNRTDPTYYVVTAVDADDVESPLSSQASAETTDDPSPSSDVDDETQNDAGTGGDASDDPDNPTILAGGKVIHINGTLVPGKDPLDAYGTNLSPNATVSMSFAFDSPPGMELNLTLLDPDGNVSATDQAPTEGGQANVSVEAPPGEHLEEGVWVLVLRHGVWNRTGLDLSDPTAPSVGSLLASLETPGPGLPITSTQTAGPTTTQSSTPIDVPIQLPVDYRDERQCDPHC